MYHKLKTIHDSFPSTGILTIGYLRFLWRENVDTNDEIFFKALLDMMSCHGIIVQGNPSGSRSEHPKNDLDEGSERFVLLNLPSIILECVPDDFVTLLKHPFRKEFIFEIHQAHVPPGSLEGKQLEVLKLWGGLFIWEKH